MKAMPYDQNGNVIGDPIEVSTRSLALQGPVAIHSSAAKYTDEPPVPQPGGRAADGAPSGGRW